MSKPLSRKPQQLTGAGRDKRIKTTGSNSPVDKFMLPTLLLSADEMAAGNPVSDDCYLITAPKFTLSN